jgi:hypothetical protein
MVCCQYDNGETQKYYYVACCNFYWWWLLKNYNYKDE